jgi:hypothetical protein
MHYAICRQLLKLYCHPDRSHHGHANFQKLECKCKTNTISLNLSQIIALNSNCLGSRLKRIDAIQAVNMLNQAILISNYVKNDRALAVFISSFWDAHQNCPGANAAATMKWVLWGLFNGRMTPSKPSLNNNIVSPAGVILGSLVTGSTVEFLQRQKIKLAGCCTQSAQKPKRILPCCDGVPGSMNFMKQTKIQTTAELHQTSTITISNRQYSHGTQQYIVFHRVT